MRTARFYVPSEWLAVSDAAFAIPAGPLYKQIVSVLRLGVGDRISLLPNNGTDYDCTITAVAPSAITGSIVGETVGAPLLPDVTVCLSILKNDHVDLVLEKCTELGVTQFIPMVTERTIKKTKEIPPRWQSIVKEASEQSGRTVLPVIEAPMTFGRALTATDGMRRILLHEGHGATLPTLGKTDRIALFVGPEGGFTDNEIAAASDASTHIVHLGDLVLRAETAAIVGTALIRLS